MDRHFHIILYILTVLAITACGKHGARTYITDEAIINAASNPDSATSLLTHIDTTAMATANDSARYNIVRLFANYYNGQDFAHDTTLTDAYRHFNDQSGCSKVMQAVAQAAAGLVYENSGSDDKAMPCYVKAANLLEGSKEWGLLSTVYAHWGWLLKVEPPYTEAMKKLKEAESYARHTDNPNRMARILGMQGWALVFNKNFAKAHDTFDRAIDIAIRHKSQWLSWLYKSKASAYSMQEKHKEALAYINKAIVTAVKPEKSMWGIKGTCFAYLGMYDSARIYIERGRLDKYHYQKATYYSEMCLLERMQGNYRQALLYEDKYCTQVDSQYEADRKMELSQAERRYNYALVAAERDNLKLDNERKTALATALAAIACALAALFVYIHQRYRHRTENALRMKEGLLQQTLSQVKERNYQLMQTQREAQDKQMLLMQTLSDKDEQIENLRQQQHELKIRMLSTNDVIHKIEQLPAMNEKKKINSARAIALTEDEQQNLIDSTNICYDQFVERLTKRFQDLTTGDVCLCCLLKLGVSSQDQSLLLNISDATLRTRKYRLKKKKMSIGDEYETLNDFITAF